MDGGAWWAEVYGVAKSQTRLSDFTFTFHFHALEKEMATHSSVLAWRIPGTGESGGLPSTGSHRVGHDWSNLAAAAARLFRIYWWLLEVNAYGTILPLITLVLESLSEKCTNVKNYEFINFCFEVNRLNHKRENTKISCRMLAFSIIITTSSLICSFSPLAYFSYFCEENLKNYIALCPFLNANRAQCLSAQVFHNMSWSLFL